MNQLSINNQNFNLELLNANIVLQKLADNAANLSITEDNINAIQEHIKVCDNAIKVVKNVHKKLKEPHKVECDKLDADLKQLTNLIEGLNKKKEYVNLCQEIDKKRQEQQILINRQNAIKKGIADNIALFINTILNSDTIAAINKVEQMVNLEKGRALAKCGEELGKQYLEQLQKLTDNIKQQKSTIKEVNTSSIEEEKQILETKVIEQKKAIVEQQINIPVSQSVMPILPEIKAKRKQWKVEIIDVKKAFEKHADILDISINPKKSIELLNQFKASTDSKNQEEFVKNGLRFYLDKSF